MKVHEVPLQEVREFMPFIYPFLVEAADHSRGQCSAQLFADDVLRGALTPLLVYGNEGLVGCVTMGLLNTVPNRYIAEVVTLAIDAPTEDWKVVVDEAIVAWARKMRCTEIEATGRVGWTRALAPLGYTPTFVTVGKAVPDAQG